VEAVGKKQGPWRGLVGQEVPPGPLEVAVAPASLAAAVVEEVAEVPGLLLVACFLPLCYRACRLLF